jgi:hypothetical protein
VLPLYIFAGVNKFIRVYMILTYKVIVVGFDLKYVTISLKYMDFVKYDRTPIIY